MNFLTKFVDSKRIRRLGSLIQVAIVLFFCGPAFSQTAPTITAISTPRQVVTIGQNLTISVSSTATPSPTYQWMRNGRPIDGATSASYTITQSVPWRDNGWYQAVVTNTVGSAKSATVFVSVAVSPAHIIGWGASQRGETTQPSGLSEVIAVDAGSSHTIALKSDGTVAAWGFDGSGQTTGVPTGLGNVVNIASSSSHSIAIKADGTLAAWGINSYGQTTIPPGLNSVVAVETGAAHSMALKSDGTVVAWGNNLYGQCTPPNPLQDVIAIASGDYHNLALRANGTVVAWGQNDMGQSSVPAGLTEVVAIAAGSGHSIALKRDGTVFAWGNSAFASPPQDLTNVVAVASGYYHTLALKTDGTIVAWGSNSYGQAFVPPGIGSVVGIAAGTANSFAIRHAARDAVPLIVTHPVGRSAQTGETVTFIVFAETFGTPHTFQWRRNGENIPGANTHRYQIEAASSSSTGNYDVVISNYLGSVASNAAALVVGPNFPRVRATHAVVGPGYIAGGSATISNTISYEGSPSRIDFSVLLPSGWIYEGGTGDDGNIKPAGGANNVLAWTWTTVPPSPFTFTYKVRVPIGTTAGQSVTALVSCILDGVQHQSLATVDPLIVSKAVLHSADTSADGRISLLELTRVIELYNYRSGTIRTGQYHVKAGTEDGFSPGP